MKSSYCRFGDCVDVQFVPVHDETRVRVGHSDGTPVGVWFTREEWAAFLAGVRNGEFDLPR